ncbi:hypothetical protein TCELL_1292 [Thermogladius calderae 1633]|uniref:Nucleotidyltransferase family protein n=1 Tax=Thermogladius calderae (strain DSM 22663 / VKM B-2946 / 1633) TaxID=1184251 RepID=I3TG27_THEC1|nr:hypothetical protein [Thermogladius calderae]AFK51715.1 hypothetical protein TCELL_1292 [Thermogladius calderae 1633]
MSSKRVALSADEFVKEAVGIVSKASERGVVLRIIGALGVYIHSADKPGAISLYEKLGRFKGEGLVFTDLDLIGYSKQRKEIIDLFEKELKFNYDPYVKALFAGKRLIYYHPQDLYHVDIFFDKLEFSHDIDFGSKPGKGLLELDYPTISLAHLVLEKLQIHEINWKDLVDLAVLLYSHNLCSLEGSKSRECIDDDLIASVLSDDWGFWYDAMINLAKLRDMLMNKLAEGALTKDVVELVLGRVNSLVNKVESTPKSKAWIKRSKIGTSKPWYRQVEELER